MNDDDDDGLLDRLDTLGAAVPDAPGFAADVTRHVAPRHARWPRSLGAIAATVAFVAAIYFATAGSTPLAFADVVAKAAQVEAVRYRQTYTPDVGDPTTQRVERCIYARGGRARTEYESPTGPATYRVDQNGKRTRILAPGEIEGPHRNVSIRNGVDAPGDDVWIDLTAKTVGVGVTDAARAALFADDPLTQLRRLALDGATPAPDEVVDGRAVHVFTSAAADPKGKRRVLVDVATQLPARIELASGAKGEGTLVLDQFEWNPPIDPTTFDPTPPAGFTVTFDAIRPLQHGLYAYAEQFDGKLPDRLDASALAAFDAAPPTSRPAGVTKADYRLELQWALDVPAFARRHGLDLVYAGAGKRLVLHKQPSTMLAAAETTPGSGVYDVLMSDVSHDTLRRDQLPTTQPTTRP